MHWSSSFRGYSFEVAEYSAVNCKIPVTAEYSATTLPRRKDNDYPPKITEVLQRWRNCSLVPREFSRQARQMTPLMTSHPKSPRTTGNEAGGIVDVVLYIVVCSVILYAVLKFVLLSTSFVSSGEAYIKWAQLFVPLHRWVSIKDMNCFFDNNTSTSSNQCNTYSQLVYSAVSFFLVPSGEFSRYSWG